MAHETSFDRVSVSYVILLFVGGAFYAIIQYAFIDVALLTASSLESKLGRAPDSSEVIATIPLEFTVVLTMPLFLSLVLTRSHPEKRVIPPLYILIISFGFLIVGYSHWPLESIASIYLFAFVFAFVGGAAYDSVIGRIMGIKIEDNQLIPYSFKVTGNTKDIVEILKEESIRENLSIKSNPEIRDDGRLVLTSKRDANYDMIIEVKDDPTVIGKSFVNLLYFDKGRYSLKMSPALQRYAQKQTEFIKLVLSEKGMEVQTQSTDNASSIILGLKLKLAGLFVDAEKLSMIEWAKKIAFLGSIAAAGIVLYQSGFEEGAVAILVAVLLYVAAIEGPKRISRNRL